MLEPLDSHGSSWCSISAIVLNSESSLPKQLVLQLKTHHVKSFACRVITPTLLGKFATTTSSAPKLHIATFCISLQVLCIFALHCSFGSPVPWLSPNRGLAILMPGIVYALVRLRHTLCLSGSLPPRFWHRKSYFRHFDNGSLTFNSSAHTIALVFRTTETYCLLPCRSVPTREE